MTNQSWQSGPIQQHRNTTILGIVKSDTNKNEAGSGKLKRLIQITPSRLYSLFPSFGINFGSCDNMVDWTSGIGIKFRTVEESSAQSNMSVTP